MKIDKSRKSKNFTNTVRRPSFIVVHHWGDEGQKFDNVVDFLCNNKKQVSAHYVVEAGRVAEIVPPEKIAWHAKSGNGGGIGIECRPECSAADVDQLIELVRYLRGKFGNIPIYPHSKFVATKCPGKYSIRINEISSLAQIVETKKVPALVVDGVIGPLTVKNLQSFLGASVDGVVGYQNRSDIVKAWPALSSVNFLAGGTSETAKALQAYLNKYGARLVVDGKLGPITAKKLQEFLNGKKARLVVDGVIGPLSAKALQMFLNH